MRIKAPYCHEHLFCLVVNDGHEPMGNGFSATVVNNDSVEELAIKIRDKRQSLLGQWDAADPLLWKPKDNLAAGDCHSFLEAARSLRLVTRLAKRKTTRRSFSEIPFPQSRTSSTSH